MELKGLVLESVYPEYTYLVKGSRHTVYREGYPVEEAKLLTLRFDRYLCEVDDMIREQEWNDEDMKLMEAKIEWDMQNPTFRDMWVHSAPKIEAPWPTYDETHHNQVAAVAIATGLVSEALTYETRGRDGGPRASVVEKLQQALASSDSLDEEVDVEEEEIAAV